MLHQLGCLLYSPPLESHIRRREPIKSGSKWEMELRGTSIWCVELIRQEIERNHPETRMVYSTGNSSTYDINIDDHKSTDTSPADFETASNKTNLDGEEQEEKAKEETDIESNSDSLKQKTIGINAILIDFFLYDSMKELENGGQESIPHHRTRSIWY